MVINFLKTAAALFALVMFLAPGVKAQTYPNTFPSAGFVGIATLTPDFALTVEGTNWEESQIRIFTYSGTPTPGGTDNYTPQIRFEKARGTKAAPTKVLNLDRIGAFLGSGWDGVKIQRSAIFGFEVDGSTSTNQVPMNFFVETGLSSTLRVQRMRITSAGKVVLSDLAGTGVRMVTASSTGQLSTQAIPTGGGTSCWTTLVDTCRNLGYATIGTNNPQLGARLSVITNSGLGAFVADTSAAGVGVYGINDHLAGAFDGIGVLGVAATYDYYGFGFNGRGGWVGGRGAVFPLGDTLQAYFGLQGIANGGTGNTDGSINVGVYGYADGADPTQNGAAFIGDWAVYADGPAYSTVSWTASDRHLKTNVRNIEYGLDALMQLQPKVYEYAQGNAVNAPTGTSFLGFVAQDLEQVIPEVVSSTNAPHVGVDATNFKEKGDVSMEAIKVVNQDGLLPVIVKAIQEQQSMIEVQAAQIEELKDLVIQLSNTNSQERKAQLIEDAFGNQLFQSVPNPASGATRINYYLNDNVNAEIRIVEVATGKVVESSVVSGKGFGDVNVDLSNYASGVYSYSLIVNGEISASKTMVVK
jgi:hypothetical protein